MSYEEGSFYKELNLTDYQKYKILILLKLYTRDSFMITHFVHTDLHNGNWKVKHHIEKNIYQIILLDFGLCTNIEKNFMRKYEDYLEDLDFEKLYDLFHPSDDRYIKKWPSTLDRVEHRESTIKKWTEIYKDGKSKTIFTYILKDLIKNKIELNHEKYELFFTLILLYNHFQNYVELQTLFNDKKHISLKKMYPDHISFCKTYNCFLEYSKYIEELVKNSDYEIFTDNNKHLEELNNNLALINSDSELDTESDSE